MEIKTRKQAILDRDNIFFTGKNCINGHLAYRYVQSGTCSECINGGRYSQNDMVDRRNYRISRQQIIAGTIRINIQVEHQLIEIMKASILAFAMVKWPEANISDVWPDQAPKHGVLFTIRCHPDDEQDIRNLSKLMLTTKGDMWRENVVKNIPAPKIDDIPFTLNDLIK